MCATVRAGRWALALALTGAGALGAQGPDTGSGVHVVRFRSGNSGYSLFSGLADSTRLVVRDSAAWRDLWTAVHRPFRPIPDLPAIDFQREMVVVAALGTRPNAGYAIVIEGVREDSSRIDIVVRRTAPAPGCPVAASMTQPVDLVRVPIRALVTFSERTETPECER